MCIGLIWQGKKMANNLFCTWEVSESRALVRCCTASSGGSAINVLFGWREQIKVTVATLLPLWNWACQQTKQHLHQVFNSGQAWKEEKISSTLPCITSSMDHVRWSWLCCPLTWKQKGHMQLTSKSLGDTTAYGSGLVSPQMNCQLSLNGGFCPTESQQSNIPLVPKHRPHKKPLYLLQSPFGKLTSFHSKVQEPWTRGNDCSRSVLD